MKKVTTSMIKQKKATLDVLERLFSVLDDIERDFTMSYEAVGKEEEQATHWKTGELMWEDDDKTIPYYRNVYDYVPIKDEDTSDEKRAGARAVDEIRAVLEKMI